MKVRMSRWFWVLPALGLGLVALHLSDRRPLLHRSDAPAASPAGNGSAGLAALVNKGPETAATLVKGLGLPQKIDGVITLESAKIAGPVVVFTVSANSDRTSLDPSEATRMAVFSCSDRTLATAITKGVMLEYHYVRRSDRMPLGKQDIAAIQCLLHAHPELAKGNTLLADGWQTNAGGR
jgi:hypothetical protein